MSPVYCAADVSHFVRAIQRIYCVKKSMETKFKKEFEDVLEAPKYLPCISLIMPFEPKLGLKKELDYKLKTACDKIEKEITGNYPEEKAGPVISKLKKVLAGLNYYTHKKSIAIFVSPVIDKVYYLDMPIEEKIIIDESFEIRDLIYSKKQVHKYLLAVLSAKWTKVYIGNTHTMMRITTNVSENILAYRNDRHEKVANFTDEKKLKEKLIDKFLMHTDNGLNLLLQSYKLPLFVIGTPKIIGHFKSITKNTRHVIDYIPGSFEEKTEAELLHLMDPFVSDWKKVVQTNLLHVIDESMSKKKLAIGIAEVWKYATQKRGRLLVVEKNFIYPARHGSSPEVIFSNEDFRKNAFYIKDAVDDIIEKVIASGGDVEFVDEGVLSEYQKIVLIEYF